MMKTFVANRVSDILKLANYVEFRQKTIIQQMFYQEELCHLSLLTILYGRMDLNSYLVTMNFGLKYTKFKTLIFQSSHQTHKYMYVYIKISLYYLKNFLPSLIRYWHIASSFHINEELLISYTVLCNHINCNGL